MSDDEGIQARITILQNAGMAEAAGERLDLVALAPPTPLAEYDPIHQQLGVADQRVEAWFKPFGGTIPTGYISSD